MTCNLLLTPKTPSYQLKNGLFSKLLLSLLLFWNVAVDAQTPTITGFSPTVAGPGTTITITGSNFTGATQVSFGRCTATSFTVINNQTIEAVLTGLGCSGNVTVTTPAGSATLPRISVVRAVMPLITSFSPSLGCPYSAVIIKGNYFRNAYAVTIGGIQVQSFAVLDNQTIRAVVGATATGSALMGKIVVQTPGGTVTSAGNYTIGKPGTMLAYIPNSGSNTVSVINTATDVVVATIPVGQFPCMVQVDQRNTKAYVLCSFGMAGAPNPPGYPVICVINTSNNSVVNYIPAPNFTNNVFVLSPDGKKLYGFEYQGNTCSVISTVANRVVANIRVGNDPSAAVLSPDGSKLFVLNSGSNSVTVINTILNRVTTTISLGNQPNHPYSICINPDGSKVYTVNDGYVSVINTATNAVTATIRSTSIGTYSTGMESITVSHDGTKVYVGTNRAFPPIPNTAVYITEINTVNNTVLRTFYLNGGSPSSIKIAPNDTKLFLTHFSNGWTNNNNITIIDLVTNSIFTNQGFVNPLGISVTPDGSKAYVTDYGNGKLIVLDAITNNVITTIQVGNSPLGLGNIFANLFCY